MSRANYGVVKRQPVVSADSQFFRTYAELEPEELGPTWESIDSNIKGLVEALNSAGYETWYSCSGGGEHMVDKAFIDFYAEGLTSRDKGEIRDIVKFYTNVPFRIISTPIVSSDLPEGYLSMPGDPYSFYRIQFKGPVGDPAVGP